MPVGQRRYRGDFDPINEKGLTALGFIVSHLPTESVNHLRESHTIRDGRSGKETEQDHDREVPGLRAAGSCRWQALLGRFEMRLWVFLLEFENGFFTNHGFPCLGSGALS